MTETASRPAPYPPDTRAKGWRFELDHERIQQSSTWALAGPEGRPWLLMLWMTAWQQVPCGSLPDDEEVIAALIGCPDKAWAKVRKALMRGWRKADDGRLYHPTIAERVGEMLEYRDKNAKRVAAFKAAKREQQSGNALPTREQRASNALPTGEQQGENDTGTGTGTMSATQTEETAHAVSARGAVGIALKAAGIGPLAVNLSDPRIDALIAAGATPEQFAGLAKEALKGKKANPMAWVLTVLPERMKQAANTAGGAAQSRHSGFASKDYRDGVNPDGSFA